MGRSSRYLRSNAQAGDERNGKGRSLFPFPLNTKRAGFVVYLYTPVCRERRKGFFLEQDIAACLVGSLNLISWRMKQDEVGTNLGPT